MEELEPRLLFSADLPGIALDPEPLGIGGPPPAPAIVQSAASAETDAGERSREAGQRQELVFIDAAAPNYQQLIDDLTKAADQGRNIVVVVLDSDRDGIEQITEALTRFRDLDAIHLVSHGSDGALQLGNGQLDQNTLKRDAQRIRGWSQALKDDADLLVYGCDVAGGSQGQTLIDGLAALTGADVAASDDPTGQAARGGDWELEYQAGDIETSLAFSTEAMESWDGLLGLGETYYLDDNGSGLNTPDAALTAIAPTDAMLTDYDPGRDPLKLPGIVVLPTVNGFAENLPDKYQMWSKQFQTGKTINDPVKFTIWTAMNNFDKTKAGSIQATLFSANPAGNILTEIVTVTRERADWDVFDTGTWIEETFDFGVVSQTIGSGRWLGVSVIVDSDAIGIAAQDSMLFAYDAVGFPARLEIGTNTAPVNIVPGAAQSTNEDTPLIFSTANLVAISDPDVVDNPMRVELKGANGTITLAPAATGLTFTVGDGIDDANMVFTGMMANINAALKGMRFDPLPNFNGAASIQITTNDLGNSGIGGPLTVTDVVSIAVAPTADAPVATSDPGSFTSTMTPLLPISYWRLGETGPGLLFDSGAAGNDAVNNGVLLGQPGAINGDGNGAVHVFSPNYVEIAHDPAYMLDDGTVQLWFKLDFMTGVQTLLSKDQVGFATGGHLTMNIQSDGSLSTRLQSVGSSYWVTSSPGAVTVGQWYQAAFSFGSQGMALYLDGRLVDTNPYIGGLASTSGGIGNTEPIAIGAGTTGSGAGTVTPLSNYMDGNIDEVAIFGAKLTADQIADLFAAGVQNYTIDENTTLVVGAREGVLANDFDADGDPLSAVFESGPTNAASFTLNPDGSFSYTPLANFSGTDSFTYRATDGTTPSNIATATITVNLVNVPPVATDNSNTVTEDIALVATGNLLTDDNGNGVDSDADVGDILTVVDINGVTDPAIGVTGSYGDLIWGTDGSYNYTLNNLNPAVRALNFGSSLIDTFVYKVSDGYGGFDTATLTITILGRDDISFAISSAASVSEDLGQPVIFTVTVSGTISMGNIAGVNIKATGSALSGTDYDDFVGALTAAALATPGVSFDGVDRLTFGNGFNGGTGTGPFAFTVNALDDSLVEGDETIIASLSNQSVANGSASLGVASTTTTITEIDALVFTIAASANPIAETGGSTTFTIDFGGMSLAPGQTASVVVTPSGGALDGTDYTAFDAAITAALSAGASYDTLTNTLTFDGSGYAGSDFQFTVNALPDTLVEGNETFTATLSAPGNATLGTTPAASVTIIDAPVFTIAASANPIAETGGSTTFSIDFGGVSLVPGWTASVVVTPSGAIDGADYTAFDAAITAALTTGASYDAATNTLTFDGTSYAGTGFQFSVDALPDTLVEGDETFTATLSAPGNAILGATPAASVTISDDDAVVFSIAASANVIAETGGGSTTFTVDFGGVSLAPGQMASVVVTPSGSATDGADYTAFDAAITAALTAGASYDTLTNTLAFDGSGYAGSDFQFTVNALADTLVEANETFTATLSAPGNATLGATPAASVTITDDDAVVFGITSTLSISEEAPGTATFTINLGGVTLRPGQTATVDVGRSGTSTNGVDHQDFLTQLDAAALATPGVTFDGASMLTFDSSFVGINSETPVNITTADDQRRPVVAVNGSGRYVTAWQSKNQDGSSDGIYARVYDAANTAVTGEVLVNLATTAGSQTRPAVVMDDAGNFVVVWEGRGSGGDTDGIYAQRFDAIGNAVGGEFLVNDLAAAGFAQTRAAVAMDSNGDFVVVWESKGQDPGGSDGVYGRRYDATGAAVGGEFRVNTTTVDDQRRAAVAMNATGEFIVAWESKAQDPDGSDGVYAQRYDATGAAVGGEFRINTTTVNDQRAPTLAMNDAGAFIVAWESRGQDPDGSDGVYGQRYDATGAAVGGEFRANTTTVNDQRAPTVAMINSGAFIVAWEGRAQDSSLSKGVYAQRYDASGASLGGEFRVNSTTANDQKAPRLGIADSGVYVVVWESTAQDAGTTRGVYSQRDNIFVGPTTGPTFTFTVDAIDDALVEGTETLVATLGGVTGATINAAQTVASTDITEADAVVFTISASADPITEAGGSTTFRIDIGGVSLVPGRTASVVVTPSGGALDGTDHTAFDTAITAALTAGVSYDTLTNTLTFDGTSYAGSGFQFSVNALPDTLVEGNETFTATLSTPTNAILGATPAASVTIIDAPVFSISASANPIAETGGSTTFSIDFGGVSLVPGWTASVVVTPSGATDGADYTAFDAAITAALTTGASYDTATNTLTFDGTSYAGTGFQFSVDALPDTLVEGDETFTATLSAPGNAILGAATAASVTIRDDDAVVFSIAASANPIAETGGGSTFSIDFGGVGLAPGQTASVVVTPSGSATDGTDHTAFDAAITAALTAGASYDTLTNTLTFDSNFNGGTGAGPFVFSVDALPDTLAEGDETFTATLSAPGNANLGATNSASVTITDDDNAPVVTAGQIFAVLESAANGASLGFVAATDADVPTTLQSWTIVSGNSGGIFAIDAASGELTVVNNTNLDFETPPASYALGIAVSDGTNTSAVQSVSVNVIDVNEAPLQVNNAGRTVLEGATAGIANTVLSVADPDIPAQTLIYTVTTPPAFGQLLRAGVPTASFTQADIDGGLLSYAHDGSETTADSFSFTVSDGAGGVLGTQTFLFSVAAVNDDPTLVNNTGLALNEGGTARIDNSKLQVTDPDNTPGQLTYTLAAPPANGQLEFTTSPGIARTTFTQAQIDAGILVYVHDGSETTADSFSFTVTDAAGGVLGAPQTFTFTVAAVNDAPVINDQTLTVDENSVAGTVVGTLAASDAEGDTLSYAIVAGNAGGAFRIDAASGQLRVANPVALDFETNPSISLAVQVTESGTPGLSDTANVTIQLNDLAEVVRPPPSPPPPPPPPAPGPAPTPAPDPTPEPDPGAGGGTIGGTGGGSGGGPGTVPPTPVVATSDDNEQPPAGEPKAERPKADKPDKPVAKPTTTTLRSVGSLRTESSAAGRSQLNSLVAAAAQADEAPVTEVEIAVAAMVNEQEGFQEALDEAQDEFSELAQIEATVVGSSAIVSTGLSVGYVVWLARGGMLLASLLSSMPAWRAIDPLPVLASFRDNDEDDDDGESLDSLVRKGGANKAAKPAEADATATPDDADPEVPAGDGATA